MENGTINSFSESIFGSSAFASALVELYNMTSIKNELNAIANEPSTLGKIELLKNVSDETLSVLYMTYSPSYVYGVKKVNPVVVGNKSLESSLSDIISVLASCHSRELTGNAAIEAIETLLVDLNEDDQQIIKNILNHDQRCGINVATINKAHPNLIEEAPPYQRCSLLPKSNIENFPDTFYSQVKEDGMFLNIGWHAGERFAISRNGSHFPLSQLGSIAEALQVCKMTSDAITLTGEAVIFRNGGRLDRQTSNGIMNSILKGGVLENKDDEIRCIVWDIISSDDFFGVGKLNVPYHERFAQLGDLVASLNEYFTSFNKSSPIELVEYKIVIGMTEAMEHYRSIRQRKLEGTVIKNPNGFWSNGTSKDCIKMKDEVDIDLKVVGLNPGKGKNVMTFGSIRVVSEDGLLEGNVSGINDELREDIFNNFESSYKDKIITVTSNSLITSKGSDIVKLFLPRFKTIRLDKSVADDLPRINEIFAATEK